MKEREEGEERERERERRRRRRRRRRGRGGVWRGMVWFYAPDSDASVSGNPSVFSPVGVLGGFNYLSLNTAERHRRTNCSDPAETRGRGEKREVRLMYFYRFISFQQKSR